MCLQYFLFILTYFFRYEHQIIDIVRTFIYLGFAFTTGDSFLDEQNTLGGQALKALLKLNKNDGSLISS